MSVTDLAVVANQVQKFWAPMMMPSLREQHPLPALVNKQYQGEIKRGGDTVYVSRIADIEGSTRTVGTDADSYVAEQLSMSRVAVVAEKRFTAAVQLEDLVDLQSQLGQENSAIRDSLLFSLARQINEYLYSKVSPSTSAPDHVINGVSDFNATQLLNVRMLAAQAKWPDDGNKWLLLDPSYMNDLFSAQTLTSSDYVGDDRVVIAGKVARERFGFKIIEDNSRGALTMSPALAGADVGLAFHPDFLLWVAQTEPTFKVSDLHGHGKFGYVISCDLIGGAALSPDGNLKHIKVYNT